MQINQEKLSQSYIFYLIANDPDPSSKLVQNAVKINFLEFY